MDLGRNANFNVNVCEIRIKPILIQQEDLFDDFQKVYSTPSKIKFTSASKSKPAGIEFINKISLLYSGLKNIDFDNFYTLVHSKVMVQLVFGDLETYQIGTKEIPLSFNVNFKTPIGTVITLKNKTIYPVKYLGKVGSLSDTDFPYTLKISL